MSMSNQAMG